MGNFAATTVVCQGNCTSGLSALPGASGPCASVPKSSSIDSVVIKPPGAPNIDFRNAIVTPPVVDNTSPNALHRLFGKGTKPDTETTTASYFPQGSHVIRRLHTLNIEIPVQNDETYNYLRELQACQVPLDFYYTTEDADMFGGEVAIRSSSVEVQFPMEQDSYRRVLLTIKWNSLADPDRIKSPLPTIHDIAA